MNKNTPNECAECIQNIEKEMLNECENANEIIWHKSIDSLSFCRIHFDYNEKKLLWKSIFAASEVKLFITIKITLLRSIRMSVINYLLSTDQDASHVQIHFHCRPVTREWKRKYYPSHISSKKKSIFQTLTQVKIWLR